VGAHDKENFKFIAPRNSPKCAISRSQNKKLSPPHTALTSALRPPNFERALTPLAIHFLYQLYFAVAAATQNANIQTCTGIKF